MSRIYEGIGSPPWIEASWYEPSPVDNDSDSVGRDQQQYNGGEWRTLTHMHALTHIVVNNNNTTFGCSKHAGQFSFIIGRPFFVAKSAVNRSLMWLHQKWWWEDYCFMVVSILGLGYASFFTVYTWHRLKVGWLWADNHWFLLHNSLSLSWPAQWMDARAQQRRCSLDSGIQISKTTNRVNACLFTCLAIVQSWHYKWLC